MMNANVSRTGKMKEGGRGQPSEGINCRFMLEVGSIRRHIDKKRFGELFGSPYFFVLFDSALLIFLRKEKRAHLLNNT